MSRHYVTLAFLITPSALFATESAVDSGHTAWMLTSTALVLMMTLPGLALFYGGLVQTRNVLSILMQCFAITAVITFLWVVAGYSIAFGEGNDWWGGLGKILLSQVEESSKTGVIPETVFSMFQLTFAIITPALIIGAFAERTRFDAVLLFSSIWFILVYAPVTHWVWGGGWLGSMGLLDFAGGVVVHVTAGIAALIFSLVIGPRRGFPKSPMTPHNMTMTVTGAGLLWVGWFGFNAGSALAADGNAGMAMLATHISAAMGAVTWMAIEWLKYGKPGVLGTVTGMVAGLATITPASGYVGPGGALIIGILGGLVCFNATNILKRRFQIDDSLDVFPVHGVGGILGTLLVGIFASTELGVFSGQGFSNGISSMGEQLQVQILGVVVTAVYTAAITWVILKFVGALVGLRTSEIEEVEGLDITSHEERGYDLSN
jgi:Amt family ammonium transporter